MECHGKLLKMPIKENAHVVANFASPLGKINFSHGVAQAVDHSQDHKGHGNQSKDLEIQRGETYGGGIFSHFGQPPGRMIQYKTGSYPAYGCSSDLLKNQHNCSQK